MSSITKTLIIGLVFPPLSYGLGYGYGKLFNADKKIAALAFLVSSVSFIFFNLIKDSIFRKPEENPKAYVITDLTGTFGMYMIQLAAFNKLNLISNLTTGILSGIGVLYMTMGLLGYCNAFLLNENVVN